MKLNYIVQSKEKLSGALTFWLHFWNIISAVGVIVCVFFFWTLVRQLFYFINLY